MPHTVDIYRATRGIDESMQGLRPFEPACIKSDFVKLLADYNSGRLLLSEKIASDQVEDWMLGLAVTNMLERHRARNTMVSQLVGAKHA